MDQQVKEINIKDLVLWTENPRDPIDENATDQDIATRALSSRSSKWNLDKLAKEMGDYYDFSELPTVVYHNGKPIVYDGNRRIILGKIKHGIIVAEDNFAARIPYFPENIPCNVCSEEIALKNVYRKHSDSGSWQPLERDIFLHKFMKKPKTPFLLLDEATNLISENPHLNKRFVKDEIFKEESLKKLGFSIHENEGLLSIHEQQDAEKILADISNKIKGGKITTRVARGKVVEVLEPSSQKIIDKNGKEATDSDKLKPVFKGVAASQSKSRSEVNVAEAASKSQRQTKRTTAKKTEFFGGKLYLRFGEVSDLYRDIADLYSFYVQKKDNLSKSFPGIIRMSLRLLCETAAEENHGRKLKSYIETYFDVAKKNLSQDEKTTLANQNVTSSSIIQLLQTGAHTYKTSSNMEQTIALSIIIGQMLRITHGKDE